MISTDNPSKKLFAALRTVFPYLVYLCLDVVHLPMTFEYASSRRRTKCSRRLRQLMRKFDATPPTWACVPNGNGGTCQPLTLAEDNKRQQVLSGALSRAAAEGLLDRVGAIFPWASRLEFIEILAAMSSLYEDELVRVVPGPNKSGRRPLYNACSAARIEWYANNLRARWNLPQEVLQLLERFQMRRCTQSLKASSSRRNSCIKALYC